jgi:hypothetical protein
MVRDGDTIRKLFRYLSIGLGWKVLTLIPITIDKKGSGTVLDIGGDLPHRVQVYTLHTLSTLPTSLRYILHIHTLYNYVSPKL